MTFDELQSNGRRTVVEYIKSNRSCNQRIIAGKFYPWRWVLPELQSVPALRGLTRYRRLCRPSDVRGAQRPGGVPRIPRLTTIAAMRWLSAPWHSSDHGQPASQPFTGAPAAAFIGHHLPLSPHPFPSLHRALSLSHSDTLM